MGEPVTASYGGVSGTADVTTTAVLSQYDNDSSIEFYRRVMGGGTLAIHYGIYGKADTHTSVAVARYQVTCDARAARAGPGVRGGTSSRSIRLIKRIGGRRRRVCACAPFLSTDLIYRDRQT